MSDSSLTSISGRLKPQDLTAAADRPGAKNRVSAVTRSTPATGDRVEPANLGVLNAVAGMKEAGPTFDTEAVTRIKQAIAEGRYPIDAAKITQKLLEGMDGLGDV